MTDTFTRPFKGIVFNGEKIGDIASSVCPPYDVVQDNRIYYDRSRYNAIRIELPIAVDQMDTYETAKSTMTEWMKNGVLMEDARETIYVYEQEFSIQDIPYLRRGFIALHRLDKKRILTHEETRKKAKEDRERLIGTLKTYTSLIFGLYEDKQLELERILADTPGEKIYDFVDEQSIRNRFYRMVDAERIAELTSLMDQRPIYIADGHHRLDVSYRLGLSYVPLYVTNMYAPGIVILPYHRIIKFKTQRGLRELVDLLSTHAVVERVPLAGQDSLRAVLDKISSSSGQAFGFCFKDDSAAVYVATTNREIFDVDEHPEGLKKLKVNVLHSGILKKILQVQDEEISFTQDAYEASELVRKGELDLAVLLPPTTVEEVKEIADNSLYMPPKSTFFYPKILTGLVFYRYA
jgi:uncharacterized protein (DUF1015 family)